MSDILKRIRQDLKNAMLNEIQLNKGNPEYLSRELINNTKLVCRSIISMFPEIGKKPANATDADTIKLLKRYINSEKHRQLYIDKHLTEKDITGLSSSELNKLVTKKMDELGDILLNDNAAIAYTYLPQQSSEEDIIAWINDNIDFSKMKNKMQAMGQITKQFSSMDGKLLKDILMNNF